MTYPKPPPPKPVDPSQDQDQSQAQLNLQAQAEGQLQGQGQGELQGQGQGQYQTQYSNNSNENENENENSNTNSNSNSLNNCVTNSINDDVNTTVDTAVNVRVDLGISGNLLQPNSSDAINIDSISDIHDSLLMNNVVNQTVTNGNNFNIDQVSNLSQDNTLSDPSVSYIGGGGPVAYDCYGCPIPTTSGDFSMTATATGGSDSSSTLGALTGNGSTMSGNGAISAAASITQEAFTQHIAMGANIQFNSLTLNNVGHDFADHAGSAAGHL